MRAFVLNELESPPRLQDVTAPAAAPGEVVIRVAACGLNFGDLLIMRGQYQDQPALPAVLGMEVAGTVAAVGAGVGWPAPGDRVAAFVGTGGLAARVACPAARCVPVPDAMALTDAAAVPVTHGTAHLALARRAGLRAGETLVVLGAASGVGLTAVTLGAAMGARVIAVARGADRVAAARDAGAAHALDSGAADFDLRARLGALGGADVVFDTIGEPLATPALRALAPEGRFLAIGFAGGSVPRFAANRLLVRNLSVIGVNWGGYLAFAPDALTDSLRALLAGQVVGPLHPRIGHVMPLDRVADGYALLRDRRATGKVVITIAP